MNLTNEQLADRFEKVGNDLKSFCEIQGLDNTEVDMIKGADNRKDFNNLCETPACHGGWFAMVYEEKFSFNPGLSFYQNGANIVSQKLGFTDRYEFQEWAHNNPGYWDNDGGDLMFCDGIAFGQDSDHFPLSIIWKHYHKVAGNLRNKK